MLTEREIDPCGQKKLLRTQTGQKSTKIKQDIT